MDKPKLYAANYSIIPRHVRRSRAFQKCSPEAKLLLAMLTAQLDETGSNNGRLTIDERLFYEAVEKGFV
ncbi:MAG: hypothetical protein ACYC3O_03275 [Burkholderiales bacterium]